MEILANPHERYGPLPSWQQADKLLASHPKLRTPQGAEEYLEKHIQRVKHLYQLLTGQGGGIWGFLQRIKAPKQFTNTVRALRVIMVWHKQNPKVLSAMKKRIEEELQQDEGLKPHYLYLLSQLEEAGQDSK